MSKTQIQSEIFLCVHDVPPQGGIIFWTFNHLRMKAEPVAVSNRIDTSIWLSLPAEIDSIGGGVAQREQGTGELSAAVLAIDVVVSVDKVASVDVETHSLTVGDSIDQPVRQVIARLGSTSEVTERLDPSVLRRRLGSRTVKTEREKVEDFTDESFCQPRKHPSNDTAGVLTIVPTRVAAGLPRRSGGTVVVCLCKPGEGGLQR